jgi:hypothetical protein
MRMTSQILNKLFKIVSLLCLQALSPLKTVRMDP